MPLIKRLSRAFKADMHAVLDSIEEPVALLKQAVREMEDDVLNDQQRLKLLDKSRELHATTQKEYQQQLEAINEEIEVSFVADNHELARKAIKRRLELEKAGKLLTRQQHTTDDAIKELQQRLGENQEKLKAMRQKLDVLDNMLPEAPADVPAFHSEIAVSDDEVEIAYLKEKQARVAS